MESKNHNLIHKMIITNKMHKQAIETVVDDIGVHRSRHQVLMKLAKSDKYKSQKEIADHLGITQAAMTVSLSKLERDGLIKKNVGKDNRYNEISITEKGREIVEHSRAHFAKVDEETFAGLTDEEFAIFENVLDKIKNNLEKLLNRGEDK